MKKILFILLFTIPFVGFGQNVRFHHELTYGDEEIYFEGSPFNGIEIWEEDGKIQLSTIKNGFENGLYQSFYSNGKLQFMGDYINGLNRNGVWRWWYENGQLRSIMIYDGTDGDILQVRTNGLISEKCWDENGKARYCD